MKKVTGVVAIVGLGIGMTWAADQVGRWLSLSQQEPVHAEPESSAGATVSREGEGGPSSGEAPAGVQSEQVEQSGQAASASEEPVAPQAEPELSAEAASIEEDLARIEKALQSEDILEEFTPSVPLSADNPIPMPTDI